MVVKALRLTSIFSVPIVQNISFVMFAKKGVVNERSELLTYGFGEVENETQWILITHGIDRMFILRVNKISVQ